MKGISNVKKLVDCALSVFTVAALFIPAFTFSELVFFGKTVITFCTHGTGGLADTISDITASLPEDCTILKPIGICRSDISDCYDEIEEWIAELEFF